MGALRGAESGWLEAFSRERPSEAISRNFEALTLRFRLKHKWVGVGAVLQMIELLARHGTAKTITPGVFKACLRRVHLRVQKNILCNPGALVIPYALERTKRLDEFLRGNSLEWASIAKFGTELRCDRKTYWDCYFDGVGRLMMLGRSINGEFGRTPGPPRPQFCSLCWRLKMTSAKYCSMHSPSKVLNTEGSGFSDDYWSARRLLPLFSDRLQILERDDRKQKLRSEWRTAVKYGVAFQWVRLRRPHVYAMLNKKTDSVHCVGEIVDLLDQALTESCGEKKRRSDVHVLFKADLAAVFTMMCRAEAWVQAGHQRQEHWGGARKGAGKRQLADRRPSNSGMDHYEREPQTT